MSDASLSSNESDEDGGTLHARDSSLTLEAVDVELGVASGAGAALFLDGGSLAWSDSELSYNAAQDAGGALNVDGAESVLLDGLTLTLNVSLVDGGGVYVLDSPDVTVQESTLTDNYSFQDGGALALFQSSVSVDTCTLSDNEAGDVGGAIAYEIDDSEVIDLVQTTFSGNSPEDVAQLDVGDTWTWDTDATVSCGASGCE